MDFMQFYMAEADVSKDTLQKILNAINSNGGEIFVVGGPVRDLVLGHDPKDIDFMVRKLQLDEIAAIASQIGKAKEVGESFGIVKAVIDGHEFDFAIPRTKETKTGDAHTDFNVEVDPTAEVEDDLGRRDFTWNAMAVPLSIFIAAKQDGNPAEAIKTFLSDPNNKQKFDPYNGLDDLEDGILQAVGDPAARFSEDPLRMLRALQFATRMGFDITGETLEAIHKLRDKLKSVSKERIGEEFRKAWTKGKTDTKVLIKLLDQTEVGTTLFGGDFNPIAIPISGEKDEKILSNFISFFLNGGDFKAMDPTRNMEKILSIAKALEITKDEPYPPFDIAAKAKSTFDWIPVLHKTFGYIDEKIAERIRKIAKNPVSIKNLYINGDEIANVLHSELNLPRVTVEPMIGKAVEHLLKAVWDEEIENKKEPLKQKLVYQIEAGNFS